jgi:hypothetical protein
MITSLHFMIHILDESGLQYHLSETKTGDIGVHIEYGDGKKVCLTFSYYDEVLLSIDAPIRPHAYKSLAPLKPPAGKIIRKGS